MFGGAGVYADGVMFGLVDEDVLYLKTDDETRSAFEAEGMEAFAYATKDGRTTIMSYWRAPERLFDEPDEMLAWARQALAVARKAGAKRKPKRFPAKRSRSA